MKYLLKVNILLNFGVFINFCIYISLSRVHLEIFQMNISFLYEFYFEIYMYLCISIRNKFACYPHVLKI